jgi:hypothetical protein
MKRTIRSEEQIIGILQVEEDQKMVWETIFQTKVKLARSALTFAASTGCRKARFMPGRQSIPA